MILRRRWYTFSAKDETCLRSGIYLFLQILLEAAVICSAGCALGLAIGWQGSHLLAQRANLPFVFDTANARLASWSQLP